jgi:molybdopterin molybdotransferase
VLILTGGISVGQFDFVETALSKNGVEKVFHRVKQKPGKPLYYGVKEEKSIFALPGNPAAVLTCFCEYTVPALRKMCGLPFSAEASSAILTASTRKNESLTCFMKGKLHGNEVELLSGQESYRLDAFHSADCLVLLEAGKEHFEQGERVEVHRFSDLWK